MLKTIERRESEQLKLRKLKEQQTAGKNPEKYKPTKTDYRIKYIIFELDNKSYTVSFKSSFLKGVYDVHIWEDEKGVWHQAKIINKYPNLIGRIKARILFHKALK